MAPSTAARVRLSIDSSMYVAGRAIDVSMSMPARPGRSLSSASSTPRVTSSVLAFGNLSTTMRKPLPVARRASPIRSWCSSTTVVTSPSRVWVAESLEDDLGKLVGVVDGHHVLDAQTLVSGVSTNPPVPGVDASRKLRGETSKRVAGGVHDLLERHALLAAACRGRPAPAPAARAGPRWRRWRRPAHPSASA